MIKKAEVVEKVLYSLFLKTFKRLLSLDGFLDCLDIMSQQYDAERSAPLDKQLRLTLAKDWFGETLTEVKGGFYMGSLGSSADLYFERMYQIAAGSVVGVIESRGLIDEV